MDSHRLLENIVSRLTDQRYLFALAGIIVVASLAPFHLTAAMAILGGSIGLIVAVQVIDRAFPIRQGQIQMTVVLDFEGAGEEEVIRLSGASWRVSDPRGGVPDRNYPVQPHRGGGDQGWLCPMPRDVSADDFVELTAVEENDQQWVADPFVPALQWPKITVRKRS